MLHMPRIRWERWRERPADEPPVHPVLYCFCWLTMQAAEVTDDKYVRGAVFTKALYRSVADEEKDPWREWMARELAF